MENTIADFQKDEQVFDEAMRAKIIERAKDIEKNPKEGKDLFQVIEDIKSSL